KRKANDGGQDRGSGDNPGKVGVVGKNGDRYNYVGEREQEVAQDPRRLLPQRVEEHLEDDYSGNVHERKPLQDQRAPLDPLISRTRGGNSEPKQRDRNYETHCGKGE